MHGQLPACSGVTAGDGATHGLSLCCSCRCSAALNNRRAAQSRGARWHLSASSCASTAQLLQSALRSPVPLLALTVALQQGRLIVSSLQRPCYHATQGPAR